MSEKLQKVLAHAGVASRRQIESWINEGRIKVNGEIATIGLRVTARDKIQVDDQLINWQAIKSEERRVLIYHKPEGEVCTRFDPEGRPTVFAKLPPIRGQRWVAIGRLDINTSGLLLFTNDGELAHRLLHPSYEIEREYAVRVLGEVDGLMLQNLTRGVMLEDGIANFKEIIDAGGTGVNHWYHVILQEGRNREARRLWESQGVKVSRLIRVRFANITLPRRLRPGRWDDLPPEEIAQLASFVNL